MKQARHRAVRITIKGHRRVSLNHERYLDRHDPDALVEPK